MALKDIHNNVNGVVAFNTAAIVSDTTTNGNIIDMQDYQGIEFFLQSGTLTDGTYTPLIEHADQSNFSDGAAVDDSDLLGTEAEAAFTDADDNAVRRIGYVGAKRYVRLSIVSASISSGGTISATAVQGFPLIAKVANNS